MKRRSFVAGAAGAPALISAQSSNKSPMILELRYFRLRNTTDNQRGKLADFLGKTAVGALRKAGAGPIGLFSSSIAPDTPFYLMVLQHSSLAAFEQCWDKAMADQEISSASAAFLQSVALPFQRMEVQLLRGFKGFPAIEIPSSEEGRAGRVFELRTYESNTPATLIRKIGMFENGEIDLFRKNGLLPIFFGETLAGPKMPNLTYMIASDNLAAREANWRSFATSAEWKKLSATPGLSDGEVVSNISNIILSPMNGSMIR